MKSRTYIATPPGATIKEQLADRGMSQKEFAQRMDMSEKHISRLINGEVQLTSDAAMRLEMVLGLPARFWNNLEAIYREKLQLVQAENEMEEDIAIMKKFPYREMAKYGWVQDTNSSEEKVLALRKHFEVVRLSMLKTPLIPGIAYRRQSSSEKAECALLAWAQRAKLEARQINTSAIDLQRLETNIPEIRTMTSCDPAEFCPRLVGLLAKCGIALVFLPHIGGSFLHGATFYDRNKIVVGLTVRGKDADKFWFSLFHELGHILKGHISNPEGTTDADEHEADAYARQTLIPDVEFEHFAKTGQFTVTTMKEFAHREGIDVGILVGRLQKEGYIQYIWFNELKTKYGLVY
ncbi:MAG: helix-turn-helix domain-containing protein [Spirochaetales bacterium]|nr:helix-turn-helix domain-containing protein [Candidatus Physcosoma equi]